MKKVLILLLAMAGCAAPQVSDFTEVCTARHANDYVAPPDVARIQQNIRSARAEGASGERIERMERLIREADDPNSTRIQGMRRMSAMLCAQHQAMTAQIDRNRRNAPVVAMIAAAAGGTRNRYDAQYFRYRMLDAHAGD
jgi:hypothetical protein